MNLPFSRFPRTVVFFALTLLATLSAGASTAVVIDHTCTDLSQIPASALAAAKTKLRIVYGHTSHGSQLTDGMTGLADWKGSAYAWNADGSGGALRLVDYYGSFNGSGAQDLGNPDFTSWASATRSYLAAHSGTNVVLWSWCGELAWASSSDVTTYLTLMSNLEKDFPAVTFVYMTCHLDGSGKSGNLNQRNEQIRSYCRTNGKVLYDFADIESYGPDGAVNYMEKDANDACDYDSDGNGSLDANWARDWQSSHTENVDWYSCGAAHTEPLNANRKAYAAWNLFARIGGWDGVSADAPGWSDASFRSGGWFASWYGWFYTDAGFGGWIYSPRDGYQYVLPTSTSGGVYLYDTATGDWWWTSRSFFPYLYDFANGTWLFYHDGASPNRHFYSYKTHGLVGEGSL